MASLGFGQFLGIQKGGRSKEVGDFRLPNPSVPQNSPTLTTVP